MLLNPGDYIKGVYFWENSMYKIGEILKLVGSYSVNHSAFRLGELVQVVGADKDDNYGDQMVQLCKLVSGRLLFTQGLRPEDLEPADIEYKESPALPEVTIKNGVISCQ